MKLLTVIPAIGLFGLTISSCKSKYVLERTNIRPKSGAFTPDHAWDPPNDSTFRFGSGMFAFPRLQLPEAIFGKHLKGGVEFFAYVNEKGQSEDIRLIRCELYKGKGNKLFYEYNQLLNAYVHKGFFEYLKTYAAKANFFRDRKVTKKLHTTYCCIYFV